MTCLSTAVSRRGVNEDTDPSGVPEPRIGQVLRDAIWRILYLFNLTGRDDAAEPPRILLAKQDFKSAFRQAPVEIEKAPVFGYVVGDFVIIDKCL